MEDKRKAYKGIKFLKVDNQFLGAQLRKSSSKALSINGNMPFVNKNFSSIRSSENSVSKSVIKSSLIKSSRNYVSKSLIKSTFNDNHSINICKKRKKKKKSSKFKEIEILKQLIEIKKEEESLTKKNPNINIKSRSNKLINQSLSSKNLEQLKNKIISFKSIIINNINNTEKTDKDNNKNDADDKKKESKENNKCDNNVIVYKTEKTVKNEEIKEKKRKNSFCFCCL